jgi:flagellar basal body-associated protein FliL
VAEIHVEKKPRSGWIWLVVLLLIVAIAVLAWLFWPTTSTATPRPATATTSDAVIEQGSAGEVALVGDVIESSRRAS